MKSIYLLLTRTNTLLSRVIHLATREDYTHVSIALDRELNELYSFARKQAAMPLPAGLVREDVHAGVFARNGHSMCALYRLAVTDAQYHRLRELILEMRDAEAPFRYSVLGLLLCRLDLAHQRSQHLFCSQFVGGILEKVGALKLPKPASLMHPMDFARLSDLERCYEGVLKDCDARGHAPESPEEGVYSGTVEHVY